MDNDAVDGGIESKKKECRQPLTLRVAASRPRARDRTGNMRMDGGRGFGDMQDT